ncbi:hypothetical protein BCR36DRAFT_581076 [Piromyces finnis]|uniref:Cyclin N-terminal domain-containing protein n=1 Tax=Piromyces finnis TaxID=1754191 RepID=A0A1Y1VGT4_9FUNG|nr:hypothetical protein BCR36DRAFT_581076 [Piromyces finnis]|eukprot:ORX55919.1 hypothetical protein BCR36DRAFT_581076 [Piromyces finnis]
MASNSSSLVTLSASPVSLKVNETLTTKPHENTKIENSTGCLYPTYKRKQPQNLKIRTDVAKYHKKTSSVYPMINQTSATEKSKVKSNNNPKTLSHKQDIEKIMENTNLICSFLKTICVDMPVDEEDYMYGLPSPNLEREEEKRERGESQKMKKPASLENFVANVLNRTKLNDIFVHIALLYVHKYLNHKRKREEARKREAYRLAKQYALLSNKVTYCKWNEFGKRKTYSSKNVSGRLVSHSKCHHTISKNDTKIKISKPSLKYILQQQQHQQRQQQPLKYTAQTIIGKKNENIVEPVGLPKESLIKTQKDLIFAAMICSSKYLDDNSYCNSAWVKLTDKSLKEVFALEREFLMSIKYELYFTNEEWKEWFTWISRFKVLLDSGMTTGTMDERNKNSPSCMVSVPSQPFSSSPNLPYANTRYTIDNSLLPSPVDIPSSYSTAHFFDKELEKEVRSYHYLVSNNPFMPSLSTVATFADCISPHHQQPMMPYHRAYRAPKLEQCPVYLLSPSFTKYDHYENCCPMDYCKVPPPPSHHRNRERMTYPITKKIHSSSYLPIPTLNQDHYVHSYLINSVDTSLISQAQNSPIDFSEIQKLTEQQNITFKKPILPPSCTSSSPSHPFDLVNMKYTSKNTCPSTSGLYIPPHY